MSLDQKTALLKQIISTLSQPAIAFSGGADSTLLADMVFEVHRTEAVALTIDTILLPRSEMEGAVETAGQIGIEHRIINLEELDQHILSNPADRCYHCKRIIFSRLLATVESMGKHILLEGTNNDDLNDYRPGLKAIEELGVRSPLLEAGLTKQEIRQLSQQRGLRTWNHPSMACLASRIPYGELITPESLQQIETAETIIRNAGFKGIRVRKHGDLARIEVLKDDMSRFVDTTLMDTISRDLKRIGFKFVSLDMEGYRTGSLN